MKLIDSGRKILFTYDMFQEEPVVILGNFLRLNRNNCTKIILRFPSSLHSTFDSARLCLLSTQGCPTHVCNKYSRHLVSRHYFRNISNFQ